MATTPINSSQFIPLSSVGDDLTAIAQENPISAATAAITNTGVLHANLSPTSNSQQLKQAQSLIYFYNCLSMGKPRFKGNTMEQADQIRSWLKQSPEVQEREVLFLSEKGLRNLPPEICCFRNLKDLDLSENQLKTIPAEIGNLKALKRLHLENNKLKDLPAEIGTLQALEFLSLYSNQFEAIPPQIGNLPALNHCNLSHNQLHVALHTPPVGNFQALRYLDLTDNQLKVIPDWIGDLTALTCLDLGNNQLESIPACIGNLPLTHLFLQNNKLYAPNAIPPQLGIGNLQTLTSLHLNDNQLRDIPTAIGNFQALRTLGLENNKLSDIPAWILNLHALTVLNLKDNDFQTVPTLIQNLPNLRELNLGSNRLHPTIPVWIGNLHLDYLGLEKNELSSLPHSLFNWPINSVVYAWEGNQFNETFVNQFLQDLQTHQAANPGQGPIIEIAANFLGYPP